MKYVVAISYDKHTDYIADGRSYTVQGQIYVPLTSRIDEAKRYTTRASATKAANRSGDNMWGRKKIIEIIGD